MIRIDHRTSIDEGDLRESFIRASGPGGQNVNKVSTAVELRYDARGAVTLPEDVLASVDAYASAHGYSRSGFLAYAAKTAMDIANERNAQTN